MVFVHLVFGVEEGYLSVKAFISIAKDLPVANGLERGS